MSQRRHELTLLTVTLLAIGTVIALAYLGDTLSDFVFSLPLWLVIGGVVVSILGYLLAFSLAVTAGRADREVERARADVDERRVARQLRVVRTVEAERSNVVDLPPGNGDAA